MHCSASRLRYGSWRVLAVALALGPVATGAAAECDRPAGELVAAEAIVELRAAGETGWSRIAPPHALCQGDQVAVRSPGRAAIVLDGDVLVRLDQETTLNLTRTGADEASELGLRDGVIHVISRFRKRFGVTTPFVNALVEGTEFTVASSPIGARIVVAEGVVRARNDRGEQLVLAGAAVAAAVDTAPTAIVVQPLDAVRWAIHYPQFVWLDGAALAALPDDLRDTVARAQREMAAARYGSALAILAASADAQPAPLVALRASVLLALGRVDEARAQLDAAVDGDSAAVAAIEAIIRVARNDNDAALTAAQHAIAAEPRAAAGHLALSYVLQARRDIPQALDAARRATQLTPENPFAWARQAELELSLAQIERGRGSAEHALARSGSIPRAQALLGFARLLDGETAAALETFGTAVAADSSDPLAHFGRGLARVRGGDLAGGRRDIEIAVLLDPTNAELRSYLGRVYVEEDRSALGGAQFDLARRLDPASPTPWYFDAFRKLRDNDPLGAIGDSRRAIELNDRRAVFRAGELLDSDRAARSVTLGAAYREVGFEQPMLAAAMRALGDDPMSPAGHRLLAESYVDTPRFEAARVSELLQAQLRQPIGQLPIPPQLLSPRLPLVDGPRALAPEETTALFDRKPSHFAASVLAGSGGTRGGSLVAARSTERAQIALGHFDYRRDGLRDLDDADLSGTQLNAQFALTPRTMVYAEAGRTARSGGDTVERLLQEAAAWDERRKHDVTTERGRLSLRHMPTVNQEFIVTAVEQDVEEHSVDRFFWPFPRFNSAIDFEQGVRTDLRTSEIALLYRAQGARFGLVTGAGAYRERRKEVATRRQTDFFAGRPLRSRSIVDPPERATHENNSAFAYLDLRPARWATVHVGASHTEFDGGRATSVTRPNGKAGLTLALTADTTLRVAMFHGAKGPKFRQQTLEPTQFAGFNQLFDDVDGTRWRRKAAGLDHRFGNGILGGVEWSRRALDVPRLGCAGDCRADWSERLHRAYVAIPLGSRAAISAGWRYERVRLTENPAGLGSLPFLTRTELLPLALWLKLGARVTTRLEAMRVRQEAAIFDPVERREVSRSDRFWLANARLSYARPDRSLGVSVIVHNLFDRRVAFQNTDLTGDPRTPLFYPDRTVVLQANVQF